MKGFPLNQMGEEPYKLSEKAAKLVGSINGQIEKLSADATALEGRSSAVGRVATSEFNKRHIDESRDVAYGQFDMLRVELKIREQLRDQWFPLRASERMRARDEVMNAIPGLLAPIREKLVGLGFTDLWSGQNLTMTVDKIAAMHPTVIAANGCYATLYGLVNTHDDRRLNDEAIEVLEREIEAGRQKLSRI